MVPMGFLSAQWRQLTRLHPLAKGVVSYAIIWPTGSFIQQTMEGKNPKTYDYMRALRFAIYGSLYVAPSLYGWVRLTSSMWPQTNLRVGLIKAAIEQISYGPFACASFFMCMNLLEGKSMDHAIKETQTKFWPTYTTAVCVWPFLQTVNFALVPERNRVVFTSLCSLFWTCFLAYMKRKDLDELMLKQVTDQHVTQKNQKEIEEHHAAELLETNLIQKDLQLNT